MRKRALLISALILTASAALTRLVAFSADRSGTVPILYTAAKQYDPLAWMTGGERFPLGAVLMIKDGKSARALVPGFSATADPNVSFDGQSVLFAGKKNASDRWQIWEMSLAEGEPRQITATEDDAIRPMYLPEDRAVYAQKQNGRFVIVGVQLDSGQRLLLSYAPGNAIPSDVLRDGRILIQAGYPLGSGSTPEIYTVYSDGSGIESYRCDHGTARYAGKQISSGDIVFTHGGSLSRFTSPMAHEVAVVAPAGEYAGDIVETSAGDWVFPWRLNGSSSFQLKQWKPGANVFSAVASESGMNLVQPVLVAERPVPNRHPSGLHEWKTANMLALNAYDSKGGSLAPHSIASVRLYSQDASGQTQVLGTAPVEKDGSFFVQVPGDRPLKFELLDAAGKTIKKQNGWMWARSGEQRICVGCHTGPERAPDNAVPAVLLRSTDPADMTGTAADHRAGGH